MTQITKEHINILKIYMEAHIDRNNASIKLFVEDYYTKFITVKDFLKEDIDPKELNTLAHEIVGLYCRSSEYYLSDKDEYHLSAEAKAKFINFMKICCENLDKIKQYGFDEGLSTFKSSTRH